MLSPVSLAFFQGGRMIRRVRSDLQSHIHSEPAARLLPGLLQIPLVPAPLPDPVAILAHSGGIALCGPPASGRSLALLQIQARWADTGAGGPVIALNLTHDDAPNLSPRALVAGAIHRTGLPSTYIEGRRPMIVLLDGWEELAPDRRAMWHSYAVAATSWSVARVVISLPPGETWFGFSCLDLVAPDDDTLAAWFGLLLPSHDPTLILAALQCEPLAALRNRIGDLLLLALIYPIIGLPTSRAQLYEQAYALACPILDNDNAEVSVGQAALRHYRLARTLADDTDLSAIPTSEISAIAPLAAGILDDPRPVLDLLWADAPILPALAACLRERPTAAINDYLRLIELLLAHGNHDHDTVIMPGLPDMFAAASHGDQARAMRALGDLATSWPGHQTVGLLLHLMDHPDATADLRWVAADLLTGAGLPIPASIADIPAFADDITLASHAYLIALTIPAQRQFLLDPALRPGLDALIAGAGGNQRWMTAAAALINDSHAPSELRILALSHAPESARGESLIQQALSSHSTALRRSALAALHSHSADDTLRLLAVALADAGSDEDVLGDLLATVAQLPQREATGLIARYALSEQCGPALRITALRLFAKRLGCAPLLQRFLAVEHMPASLRAAAAQLLGTTREHTAVPLLRRILLSTHVPILRRSSADGLAHLARVPISREAAIASLIAAIAQPDLDATLTARIAAALGSTGATQAIPALTTLLDPGRPAALRATWLAAIPELDRTPTPLWPTIVHDPSTRAVLLDNLASGETSADPPSSLDELVCGQAERAAIAAAEALATFAERCPTLAHDLCVRIRQAILNTPGPHAPVGLLRALARAAGTHAPDELEAILDARSSTPTLRWAAIDQLGRTSQAAAWLLERLRSGGDDIFTRGKLADILGELGELNAIPILCAIATDPAGDPHLRLCAIGALGRLGTGGVSTALLQIIKDSSASPSLRAAAITALSHPLADDAYDTLHQFARAEGTAHSIATAIGQSFARVGEREILPLLLRGAQSTQPQESIAAISAIADLGDQSAVSLLVRISQSATVVPGVRLAAINALLQLEGPTHLPLLHAYLESPVPPLRIMAHQILAQTDPDDWHLIEPATDVTAPLALRLLALERLITQSLTLDMLFATLRHPDEPLQLRLGIAEALGRTAQAESARVLHATLRLGAPPLLRRRCITAIGELSAAPGECGEVAWAIIVTLAQGSDTPAEERHWATEILLHRVLPKDVR